MCPFFCNNAIAKDIENFTNPLKIPPFIPLNLAITKDSLVTMFLYAN